MSASDVGKPTSSETDVDSIVMEQRQPQPLDTDWMQRGEIPTKFSSKDGFGRYTCAWFVVLALLAVCSLICAAVSIQFVKALQTEVAELQQQSSSSSFSSSSFVNASQLAEVMSRLDASRR
eukprot:m.245026 g.245026  ORF g.245026 m.245026 type:complete len:121 (-) comp15357_c0_seq7:692-1054(-)